MIGESSDLVGYSLYLDLIAGISQARPGTTTILAARKTVCAMPWNLPEREGMWRLSVRVMPEFTRCFNAGIRIAQRRVVGCRPAHRDRSIARNFRPSGSRSAPASAPLGHDFCTISLSDLLTPWPDIQRRVKAAAGDFVIAFYNPVSRRRRTRLAHAREYGQHRPHDTR
ncbi:MAG: hypothetical protein R3D34_09985 [Nitratireductor sp.]